MFNQKGSVAAVYRTTPENIRAFDELGLPAVMNQSPAWWPGLAWDRPAAPDAAARHLGASAVGSRQ